MKKLFLIFALFAIVFLNVNGAIAKLPEVYKDSLILAKSSPQTNYTITVNTSKPGWWGMSGVGGQEYVTSTYSTTSSYTMTGVAEFFSSYTPFSYADNQGNIGVAVFDGTMYQMLLHVDIVDGYTLTIY